MAVTPYHDEVTIPNAVSGIDKVSSPYQMNVQHPVQLSTMLFQTLQEN